eukprot:4932351-Pleurochrysis_carterae.AAC.4
MPSDGSEWVRVSRRVAAVMPFLPRLRGMVSRVGCAGRDARCIHVYVYHSGRNYHVRLSSPVINCPNGDRGCITYKEDGYHKQLPN